jgi:hypothetical protein
LVIKFFRAKFNIFKECRSSRKYLERSKPNYRQITKMA